MGCKPLGRLWQDVVVGVLIGLLATSACADPVGPTSEDRQVTLAVVRLLQRDHLSRRPLDDEIAQRCLKKYLKMLDPMKLYFYQSDVDSFWRRVGELDEAFQRGDTSFGFEVFKVFLQRVDERIKWVDELLNMDHDFSVDEELFVDRDSASYPANAQDARELWRKRIKYDLLTLKVDKIEGQQAREKLARRYHSFAKRMHQTDNEEVLEMYLSAMTQAFDPHTEYQSPRTKENFEILMKLELEGIGASLQYEDGYTKVHKIIPGGAADKDGRLKVGDRIVGVGQGTDGEIVDVVDMKLSDVVALIRGKKGTVVRLEVISGETGERKIITLTRAKIELKDSEAQGEIFTMGKKPDGSPYKIGVIDLPSFYMDMAGARMGLPMFKSTTRDVRRILEDFNAKGVDALVLDLRRNGGGALTEAINLTGLFIDEGPVVQVKDPEGRVQPYLDSDPEMLWKGPLVVLVSKFSASASEILAGAIQDYRRGLVVGDQATHGKGTVQTLLDIGREVFRIPNAKNLGALKVTVQQFYRPSGDSTQNRGVLADIQWPSLSSHLDIAEADLDYALPFDRVDPVPHKTYDLVNPDWIRQLAARSAARCEASADFQKVAKTIDRYKQQKARKTVTLNEQKFLAERAELNVEEEEKKKIEENLEPKSGGIQRDFYLNEALAITLDYLELLRSKPPIATPQQGARHIPSGSKSP
ncbi:MAG: carboxy terminal-processing peptidase [Thermoguttaceae bacterium]|nr:carboxy terminal-processing peptidase [Thermoguttaceae bacterium]MDW8039070.1 carboxy terminal-processing peptidase [Thermoguttaceae bacterium]